MRGRTLVFGLAFAALAATHPAGAGLLKTLYDCKASGTQVYIDDQNYSGTTTMTMTLRGTCTALGGIVKDVALSGGGGSNLEILNYDGQLDPDVHWGRYASFSMTDRSTGAVVWRTQRWQALGLEPLFRVNPPGSELVVGYGNVIKEDVYGCEPNACYANATYRWHFIL